LCSKIDKDSFGCCFAAKVGFTIHMAGK